MLKRIESFVEMKFQDGNNSYFEEKKTDSIDPLSVENDGKMEGFRFVAKELLFDVEPTNKEYDDLVKGTYIPKTIYESGFYYFGTRMNRDEMIEVNGENPLFELFINEMEMLNCDACLTQTGAFHLMHEGDMTMDEYVKSLESVKQVGETQDGTISSQDSAVEVVEQ